MSGREEEGSEEKRIGEVWRRKVSRKVNVEYFKGITKESFVFCFLFSYVV